jgi:hypothetical protein
VGCLVFVVVVFVVVVGRPSSPPPRPPPPTLLLLRDGGGGGRRRRPAAATAADVDEDATLDRGGGGRSSTASTSMSRNASSFLDDARSLPLRGIALVGRAGRGLTQSYMNSYVLLEHSHLICVCVSQTLIEKKTINS